MNLIKQTVTFSLIIYLSWQLSILVWLFIPTEAAVASDSANVTIQKQDNVRLDVNTLISFNFFGRYQSSLQIKSKQERQITAPETTLRLKLRGLRKGQGTIPSSAIIEDAQRVQDIYYLGDLVPGNSKAVVHEIYSQRLILKRGGKYETLTLFDVLEQQKNKSKIKSSKKYVEPAVSKPSITPVIDRTRNKALTKKLSIIADKLTSSPLSLNGTMIINESKNSDGFQGYEVAPGKDKVLFAHLGLKKGDVITGINDVELDSATKIMSLIGVLSSAQELEIKVIRGSQPLAFRYKVR